MRVPFCLIIVFFLLSGCAATNGIHNSRHAMREDHLKNVGFVKDVLDVAYDEESGNICFCLKGNFFDEMSSGDYQLIVTPSQFADYPSKIKIQTEKTWDQDYKYHISYEALVKGCKFRENNDLFYFSKKENKDKSFIYYLTEGSQNKSNTKTSTKWISAKIANEYVLDKNRNRVSATSLKISGKVTSRENNYFIVDSIDYNQPFDIHDFEMVGNLIDTFTVFIQVPLCLITGFTVCSGAPHPSGGGRL